MPRKKQEIMLVPPQSPSEVMPFQVGQRVGLSLSSMYDYHLLPKEGTIVGTRIHENTGEFVYLVEVTTDDLGNKVMIDIPPERVSLLK